MTNAKDVLEYMAYKEEREWNMTNEEWLNTLSTTEEKAEAIFECVMANSWSLNKDGIKRWLKQPHTIKE